MMLQSDSASFARLPKLHTAILTLGAVDRLLRSLTPRKPLVALQLTLWRILADISLPAMREDGIRRDLHLNQETGSGSAPLSCAVCVLQVASGHRERAAIPHQPDITRFRDSSHLRLIVLDWDQAAKWDQAKSSRR